MASKFESGYNINVAHVQQLIQYAQQMGATYNPSKPALVIAALQTLHDDAKAAIANVQTTSAALINVVNARQAAYGPLKKKVTRIINALDASDVDDAIVKDARTIVRKITGLQPNVL